MISVDNLKASSWHCHKLTLFKRGLLFLDRGFPYAKARKQLIHSSLCWPCHYCALGTSSSFSAKFAEFLWSHFWKPCGPKPVAQHPCHRTVSFSKFTHQPIMPKQRVWLLLCSFPPTSTLSKLVNTDSAHQHIVLFFLKEKKKANKHSLKLCQTCNEVWTHCCQESEVVHKNMIFLFSSLINNFAWITVYRATQRYDSGNCKYSACFFTVWRN